MSESQEKKDIKKGLIVSLIVLIGKALGFVKQSVIAWAFGINSSTDVLFAADGYTSMFGQIMGQSISPCVLTGSVALKERNKKEEAINLVRSAFVFFSLIALLVTFLSAVLSPVIANVVGSAYSVEQKDLLRVYVICLSPVILLSAVTGVSQGYLESKRIFGPGKIFSFLLSFFIITFVLLFRNTLGVTSILVGLLTSYVIHCFVMLFVVNRDFKFRFVNPLTNTEFKSILKKFLPLLISVSVLDFGMLVDRTIASGLESGSVSALYYGQIVSNDVVNSAVVGVIGAILLPSLTKMVAQGLSVKSIVNRTRSVLIVTALLVCAISGLYFVEGYDLVSLFFERGQFGPSETQRVYEVAICYACGFVFLGFYEVLTKAHYAFSDMIWPMICSVVGVTTNISLSLILCGFLGVSGIAVATSVSMLVAVIMSFFSLRKHTKETMFNIDLVMSVLKIVASTTISVLSVVLLKNVFSGCPKFASLFLFGLVFIAIYITLLTVFREKELFAFFHYLKNIFGKSKKGDVE